MHKIYRSLLQHQLNDSSAPELSPTFIDRTEQIAILHYRATRTLTSKISLRRLFLGGSIVALVSLGLFVSNMVIVKLSITHDPELSSIEQELDTMSIPTESFE